MRKLIIVAAAALALACYDVHGSRSSAIGSATLETVYLRYRIPATYLLFVPDIATPREHDEWAGEVSVGPWNAKLRLNYTLYERATSTRIDAHTVVIRGTILRADGKSFDLTRGNVLVVHMDPRGSLSVTQLPERRGADESPRSIVSLIKAALPNDVGVQALPLP